MVVTVFSLGGGGGGGGGGGWRRGGRGGVGGGGGGAVMVVAAECTGGCGGSRGRSGGAGGSVAPAAVVSASDAGRDRGAAGRAGADPVVRTPDLSAMIAAGRSPARCLHRTHLEFRRRAVDLTRQPAGSVAHIGKDSSGLAVGWPRTTSTAAQGRPVDGRWEELVRLAYRLGRRGSIGPLDGGSPRSRRCSNKNLVVKALAASGRIGDDTPSPGGCIPARAADTDSRPAPYLTRTRRHAV